MTIYQFRSLGLARGDVAVVTGAGDGIGRSVVLMLARSGLTVAAWDMEEAAVESVATKQGPLATADGGRTRSAGNGRESRQLGISPMRRVMDCEPYGSMGHRPVWDHFRRRPPQEGFFSPMGSPPRV